MYGALFGIRLSLLMVITPKHVGAVLMSILKLFLRQFNCASVGK
jgi:hypothetical protein